VRGARRAAEFDGAGALYSQHALAVEFGTPTSDTPSPRPLPRFAGAREKFSLIIALACLCVLLASSCVLLAGSAFAQDAPAPSDSAQTQSDQNSAEPKPPATIPGTPFIRGDQKRFDEGAAAFDAHDYERAFKIFSALADNEDLAAMRNVAFMQRKGLGTERDPEAAQQLLEYVARAGLPTAQFDLGEMLLDGEAGDPKPTEGIAWLELAARASHPIAQYRLGVLYEEGTLVPKDLFKAQLLYSAAAQHGSKKALERLSAMKGWPKPDGTAAEPVPGLQPLDPGPISPGKTP
jgi:TPR repeat protein